MGSLEQRMYTSGSENQETEPVSQHYNGKNLLERIDFDLEELDGQIAQLEQNPFDGLRERVQDKYVSISALKNMGNKTLDIMGKKAFEVIRGSSRGLIEGLFVIPSVARKAQGSLAEVDCYKNTYGISSILFFTSSVLTLGIIPILSYKTLFEKNYELGLAILGTQITTNLASGLYEWYRYEKKKLENKDHKFFDD